MDAKYEVEREREGMHGLASWSIVINVCFMPHQLSRRVTITKLCDNVDNFHCENV